MNATLRDMRIQHRYDRLLAALGTDEKGRVVARCLASDDRPWRVQTISEQTGFSRASVRAVLENMQAAGLTARGEDGWTYTEYGMDFMLRLREALTEIAEGRRNALPEALMAEMEQMNENNLSRPFLIPRHGIL